MAAVGDAGKRQTAEKDAARLARVITVLDEWGMSTTDGGFVGDEDFAEAIEENGAWRLARDLRAALGQTRDLPSGVGDPA